CLTDSICSDADSFMPGCGINSNLIIPSKVPRIPKLVRPSLYTKSTAVIANGNHLLIVVILDNGTNQNRLILAVPNVDFKRLNCNGIRLIRPSGQVKVSSRISSVDSYYLIIAANRGG